MTMGTPMSEERIWDDKSREELRQQLRTRIIGELRLASREHDDILEMCREVYIQDEYPDTEIESFVQFSANQLDNAARHLASEKASWLDETDCDRLDRVEGELRDRGIVLWQVSPCCDSCTMGEFPDRVDVIDGRFPGFRDRLRGYTFFIDQNMPEMLADSTDTTVFLGYGWISTNGTKIAPEEYEKKALAIAHEICECLRKEGFEPDWNGSSSKKIGVSLNWQRRTILE
jgi:hypothetical protein